MKLFTKVLSGLFALLLVIGCVQKQQSDETDTNETNFTKAIAMIHPIQDNTVSGHVTFTKDSTGIRVEADVTGFGAVEKHGFHIHEYGDCSAQDGTSAGGHYAPDGSQHGEPGPNSHDGDLGNLVSTEEGNATLDITSTDITLNGPKSIIGRGIIIHSGADDFTSQPSGAAGSRIACGVIGVANSGQ